MGLLSSADGAVEVRAFPGADRVLAVHEPPQPDLMCGPFAVRTALAALVDPAALPSLEALAHQAGTRTWPEDLPGSRPSGAPSVPAAWAADLPVAESPDRSGTDAADLVGAVVTLTTRDVTAVPARRGTPDGLLSLLERLGALGPFGVVANVRTGPTLPEDWSGAVFDVGHFVVLWGLADGQGGVQVAVADSYDELGQPGLPPACRLVPLTALHEAMDGRGLLLLVRTSDVPVVDELVRGAGLSGEVWSA